MKHTSINIEDVIAWQKTEIEKGRDGTNIPQRFNKKLGLYRFFQTNDIIKLAERSKTLSSDEIQMLEDYNIMAYGFFCNSVDRWSDIHIK